MQKRVDSLKVTELREVLTLLNENKLGNKADLRIRVQQAALVTHPYL
mgnify:CR=1 FL=1